MQIAYYRVASERKSVRLSRGMTGNWFHRCMDRRSILYTFVYVSIYYYIDNIILDGIC